MDLNGTRIVIYHSLKVNFTFKRIHLQKGLGCGRKIFVGTSGLLGSNTEIDTEHKDQGDNNEVAALVGLDGILLLRVLDSDSKDGGRIGGNKSLEEMALTLVLVEDPQAEQCGSSGVNTRCVKGILTECLGSLFRSMAKKVVDHGGEECNIGNQIHVIECGLRNLHFIHWG